ncbi:hypothetical protein RUND412_011681 [Rhizina undulata]
MFSVKSILATAAAAFIASAEAATYGLISIDSGSPVHLKSVIVKDNKLVIGGTGTFLSGDVATFSGSQTGFAISSFSSETDWLTILDDGSLAYQEKTAAGTVTGQYSSWSWTDSSAPHLAYNGVEGAIACYTDSTGEAQLYFQTGANTVTCPSGTTTYGISLRRV